MVTDLGIIENKIEPCFDMEKSSKKSHCPQNEE